MLNNISALSVTCLEAMEIKCVLKDLNYKYGVIKFCLELFHLKKCQGFVVSIFLVM